MKKILVTGCNGFIGTHLVNRLMREPGQNNILGISRRDQFTLGSRGKNRDINTYCTKHCDLTDYAAVKEIMGDFRPNVIYHLAANPLTRADEVRPCSLTADNVLATHHLLECCPSSTNFIFTSSATVYGNGNMPDNDYPPPHYLDYSSQEIDDYEPTSAYGASKAACELYIEAYARLKEIRPTVFRLVANVGAYASHGLLLDIVHKLLSPDEKLNLLGDCPGSIKPFCHVGDTVEALVNYQNFRDHSSWCQWNLSPNDSMSVLEVAETVMEAIGIRKEIAWGGSSSVWPGDNPVVKVSGDLARNTCGWKPKYPTSKEAVYQAAKELYADLTFTGAF